MSLCVGDRVYHRGAKGNGVIVTINEDLNRDKYGIKFFWSKYKKMKLHNLNGFLSKPMGVWASEDKITKTPMPTRTNAVTVMGTRSLDKLIRNICEFPHHINCVPFYGSDYVIHVNYGTFKNAPQRGRVINRHLVSDKYEQCRQMLENGVSVPFIARAPFEGCIQKPFHSMGGKNIKKYSRGDITYGYFQKEIKKVREFRAHVFLWGECKVPLIQEKTVDDPTQLTWNKKQGGKFHTVFQHIPHKRNTDDRLFNKIVTLSVEATKAIGYDMGGVDLALDNDGKLWVFEINSRMGLREKSLCTYKTKFWELYNATEV